LPSPAQYQTAISHRIGQELGSFEGCCLLLLTTTRTYYGQIISLMPAFAGFGA